MSASSTPRRKPGFPGSLTDLHRFRKTVHGHDGSSRIVMVRKTDQRTYASMKNGQEPKLETITRETIETFRGQRTECKITTEKKDCEETLPPDLICVFNDKNLRTPKKSTVSTPKRIPVKVKTFEEMGFEEECLKSHNDFRKRHGVPPLKLNKDLCKISQKWADYLITQNCLQHSDNIEYGENLYCCTSTVPSIEVSGNEPVEYWYSEIKVHEFGVEKDDIDSGHFTQVVWKDSKELGVALAKQNGRCIVVANYYPPGNLIGDFKAQVLPPTYDDADEPDIVEEFAPPRVRSELNDCVLGDFELDFLNAHNEYRKIHSAPPLKLDKKLCEFSQGWANHLATINQLEHSPNCNYGENIYCLYSSNPNHKITGRAAVDSWYKEMEKHEFGIEPSVLDTGHFTQIVWKSSQYLGVGVAKGQDGKIYVVGNYSPAGNYVQKYVENVLPPNESLLKRNLSNSNAVLMNEEPKPNQPIYNRSVNPEVSSSNANKVDSKPKLNKGIFASLEKPLLKTESPNYTTGNFEMDFLNAHNEFRQKHGVPPLKLDKKICDYSQKWANHLAVKNVLEHRTNGDYGENLYCLYSSNPNHKIAGRIPVESWYNEIEKYVFGKEANQFGTGHFTQVIWKSSEFLGVGIAKSSTGKIYVVGNYSPAGNFIGNFVENVPPPTGTEDQAIAKKEVPAYPKTIKRSSIAQSEENPNLNCVKDNFELDCLDAHNEYRKMHRVPPLKLDKTISKMSQEWANYLAEKNILEHSSNRDYGENIYCLFSSNPNHTISGRTPVDIWYKEIENYNFENEPDTLASGHFTQVVWKSSEYLGVGAAKNSHGKIYVVANYSPAGNYVNRFLDNVPPPVGSTSTVSSTQSGSRKNIDDNQAVDNVYGEGRTTSTMEFQHECLKAHNEYRKKHGVAPLILNKDMCKVSQDWANFLINKGTLQHSNNQKYGENLYCCMSSNVNATVSGKEPVENWYSEIKFHEFGVEMNSLASGHFTQVVWKDSRQLGIAMAKLKGKIVVVANYYPPGNIIGQFATQVLPLGSSTNNNNDSSVHDDFKKLTVTPKSSSNYVEKTDVVDGNFELEFLNAHNEYRKRHGVSPLKLDKKLCKASQEWANHLAAKNILEHRPSSNYGENIYCLSTSDPNYKISGHAPVDSWYEEVHKHNFEKEPSSLSTGHFTQVVWKASEFLGVGVAKNSQGRIIVVGNYLPAGNFVQNFVENVPPPIGALKNEEDQEESVADSNLAKEFNQFALDGLKVHNEYRRKHGVSPLRLTKELCDLAQDWADTCAKNGTMVHRSNCQYGENIFCVYSSDFSHVPSARDAVQEWYAEIKQHRFDTEHVNHSTLHFTQLVWKETTELGFAMSKNKKGETYVVANYNPRGNYVGQFLANVVRPRS